MIEITSMDHNGRGIGKLNNKIVFVKNALPGEIVNLKILKEKKNFIEAEVLSYIKKAHRGVPRCAFVNDLNSPRVPCAGRITLRYGRWAPLAAFCASNVPRLIYVSLGRPAPRKRSPDPLF